MTTFLDLLQATQGDRLLRLKGIVETAEDRVRPLVVHAVQEASTRRHGCRPGRTRPEGPGWC